MSNRYDGSRPKDKKLAKKIRRADERALVDKIMNPAPGETDWKAVAQEYVDAHGPVTPEEIRKLNEPIKESILRAFREERSN